MVSLLIGYSVMNQYRPSILELHQQHIDNGWNNIIKEQLMSNRVKKLVGNMKQRKKAVEQRILKRNLPANFHHILQ